MAVVGEEEEDSKEGNQRKLAMGKDQGRRYIFLRNCTYLNEVKWLRESFLRPVCNLVYGNVSVMAGVVVFSCTLPDLRKPLSEHSSAPS